MLARPEREKARVSSTTAPASNKDGRVTLEVLSPGDARAWFQR